MSGDGLIFEQLFEPASSTYTYLLADPSTREAILIDPVLETVDRDLELILKQGLQLKWVLETHIHADHITGAGELRTRVGAQIALGAGAQITCANRLLKDGDRLKVGAIEVLAISTPGHTNGCTSYLVGDRVFTGDSLMIKACGRTDFQQGNSQKMFESVFRLYQLDENTRVYPGHDYKGQAFSTIGEEKKHNPRISEATTLENFVKTMSELKLAPPKRINEAVPANLQCGCEHPDLAPLEFQMNGGVPEVGPEVIQKRLGRVRLIDVRRPEEYTGELGHIPGAELITMGPELMEFLEKGNRDDQIVFVCRSGARSANVTLASREMGYQNTLNLTGGMLLWNRHGFERA